jgi:DNA-binding NarL/FixJ family response regulator
MLRSFIADDSGAVRLGLRAILEENPSWQVVGEAPNGQDAIVEVIGVKPDIAVIGASSPRINSIEMTGQIRAQLPKTEALIFTIKDNETTGRAFAKLGCMNETCASEAARRPRLSTLRCQRPYPYQRCGWKIDSQSPVFG